MLEVSDPVLQAHFAAGKCSGGTRLYLEVAKHDLPERVGWTLLRSASGGLLQVRAVADPSKTLPQVS